MSSVNNMAAAHCILLRKHGENDMLELEMNTRMWRNLSDFKNSMGVGARQAGMSIPETGDVLRFSSLRLTKKDLKKENIH